MAYRRILTIQDISCVGQCSMTVALPILSACGHEVCILPAAVLSTHTGGFTNPAVTNLTGSMDAIWRHWQREGVTFDAIYTGYLGSLDAVRIASEIMDALLAPDGIIIVDPAMADHGKLYKGLSEEYASAMINLCMRADIVLPNVTEAAMMAGMPFRDHPDESYIAALLENLGERDVVLTGGCSEPGKTGAVIRSDGEVSCYFHERVDRNFHGTGDIFASAFTGALMQEKSPSDAARIAADFTHKCILNTVENPAHGYGVKFETALIDLIKMLQ